MGNGKITLSLAAIAIMIFVGVMVLQTAALLPFTRSTFSLWDWDTRDPFRILEHTPVTLPKELETLALVSTDWKETPSAHVVSLDIPGIKRDDLKIEIQDRVLRVSGERKAEEEVEGDKWHRAERTVGRFWREFRLPSNADLDGIKAHMQNGVLRITVPKLYEENKTQPRLVNILDEPTTGEDVKATKDEL